MEGRQAVQGNRAKQCSMIRQECETNVPREGVMWAEQYGEREGNEEQEDTQNGDCKRLKTIEVHVS